MNRIVLVAAIVLGLAALLFVSSRRQAEIARGLPPRIVCASQAEAKLKAGFGAIEVLGTGSMAPYIRPAAPGLDPLKTVVAYVVTDPAETFESLKVGALAIYAPSWSNTNVMHQAVLQDGFGWIMSGLHNKTSEASWRVTPGNYKGTVARVYVWAE